MNNHIQTTLQKMKSPQHLQEHTQYLLQDHQKPQTSSKQVQINENNQLKLIHTQHQLGNHHYYPHHQHQRGNSTTAEIQPLQDLHHSTTDFTNNHSLQDHHQSTTTFTSNHTLQDHSTINRYHYCHYHHTRFQHCQYHSHTHQDISHSKYIIYQSYYSTCHNTIMHRSKKTKVNIKTFHDINIPFSIWTIHINC